MVLITAGVKALGRRRVARLLTRVRAYDAFDAGNDPYGEHDFGVIEDRGQRFFWKVDYCDRSLTHGSPDPADPTVTTRVLTLMRGEEW